MNQEQIIQELQRSRRMALDLVELAVSDQGRWQQVRAKLLRLFGNIERAVTEKGRPSNDGLTGGGYHGGVQDQKR